MRRTTNQDSVFKHQGQPRRTALPQAMVGVLMVGTLLWPLGSTGCVAPVPSASDNFVADAFNAAAQGFPTNPNEAQANELRLKFLQEIFTRAAALSEADLALIAAELTPVTPADRIEALKSFAVKVSVPNFFSCLAAADAAAGRTTVTTDIALRVTQINDSGCLGNGVAVTVAEYEASITFVQGVLDRVSDLSR